MATMNHFQPSPAAKRARSALAAGLRTIMLAAACWLVAEWPALAAETNLPTLINAYRAAPQSCNGIRVGPLAPLDAPPALSMVRIGPGTFLDLALERAGYPSEYAEAIYLTGPADAASAMALLQDKYCGKLLNTQFASVGASRAGDSWTIILAQPREQFPLPDPGAVAADVLRAVNAARAMPRVCGERLFSAAPPLMLNQELSTAALAHSRNMATLKYFSHQEKDGSMVGERALRAGYAWQLIGENIASGQHTAQEAVAGWLESPGHCANIMNAGFGEMGAAYAINQERGTLYWTQVFGSPR
jgi:uncharacterized protein YkwD